MKQDLEASFCKTATLGRITLRCSAELMDAVVAGDICFPGLLTPVAFRAFNLLLWHKHGLVGPSKQNVLPCSGDEIRA